MFSAILCCFRCCWLCGHLQQKPLIWLCRRRSRPAFLLSCHFKLKTHKFFFASYRVIHILQNTWAYDAYNMPKSILPWELVKLSLIADHLYLIRRVLLFWPGIIRNILFSVLTEPGCKGDFYSGTASFWKPNRKSFQADVVTHPPT